MEPAKMDTEANEGQICEISGPVVKARGLNGCTMREMVFVGKDKLIGEAIKVDGGSATIQVFENTEGMGIKEPVQRSHKQMSVKLGPGLIGGIFDGIQRPLNSALITTYYIPRGVKIPVLDRDKKWYFHPREGLAVGDIVHEGDSIGFVWEGKIKHHILIPPGTDASDVRYIAGEGEYTVEEVIMRITDVKERDIEVRMHHDWPVRDPRPVRERLSSHRPLNIGQRVIDVFFPVLIGGTAAIPGAFGCGKTSLLKAISKYSETDVFIFVGCGERGNEIAELIKTFKDMDIMNRSIIIANVSNMPVAARESSIYAGITIAEYYRDMGLQVTMVADSTSRWAEALREISGRLAEVPGDAGYPTYLNSRISAFYERAGLVEVLGKGLEHHGSVTLIGAVSPPSGDFSDPVTQATLSVVQTFWGLSARLASERHYPAVDTKQSWNKSITSAHHYYGKHYRAFVDNKMREKCKDLLEEGGNLRSVAQMQGKRSLTETERVKYEMAELIKTDFLFQDGTRNKAERFCPFIKTMEMLGTMLVFYEQCIHAVKISSEWAHKITWDVIEEELEEPITTMAQLRSKPADDEEKFKSHCHELRNTFKSQFADLKKKRMDHPH